MPSNNYQIFETEGNNVISSKRTVEYGERGDQHLYRITETRFLGYEWVKVWSRENESNIDLEEKVEITTSLKYLSNEQLSMNLKLSASVNGMGLEASSEFGIEHKTFTEEETNESTCRKRTVKCGPQSAVHLYQKMYKLQTDVWFILDAWGSDHTVGNWHQNGPRVVETPINIKTKEFKQTSKALSGKTYIKVNSVKPLEKPKVKEYEKCTDHCQIHLKWLGI